jgi:3-methyladenine DNA glycosylase/8-oxoguanine DNA glycosylase
MTKILFLETPKNFNFRQTIYSHGWCELLPFEIDAKNWRLSYVFGTENPAAATISEEAGKLKIEVSADEIDAEIETSILRGTRHILRIDDDLSGFYSNLKSEKRLAWIAKKGAGRMLRSATVFEDLVKTICTTNCSWSLTKKMTINLVEKLGAETKDGKRAFPTVERMASVSAEFYRDEIRAGYRSAYFAELAQKVLSGEINPESWLDSDLPTNELKKEMKKVKGVGDYAAENLLKLVGRADGLALDSWLRSQFYKNHNDGEICDDKQIEAFYEKFGSWRGLAIWCDMTEKWIDKSVEVKTEK